MLIGVELEEMTGVLLEVIPGVLLEVIPGVLLEMIPGVLLEALGVTTGVLLTATKLGSLHSERRFVPPPCSTDVVARFDSLIRLDRPLGVRSPKRLPDVGVLHSFADSISAWLNSLPQRQSTPLEIPKYLNPEH